MSTVHHLNYSRAPPSQLGPVQPAAREFSTMELLGEFGPTCRYNSAALHSAMFIEGGSL
jgi:hypothetical protein